jgi:integrase/recombinase XerD
MEHIIGERNHARNTQQSNLNAVRLLTTFAAWKEHRKPDELLVADIDPSLLREFLRELEETRKCGISSRNQRLTAIHGLATFIGGRYPEYLDCALNFGR